jgi:hypothetical protein
MLAESLDRLDWAGSSHDCYCASERAHWFDLYASSFCLLATHLIPDSITGSPAAGQRREPAQQSLLDEGLFVFTYEYGLLPEGEGSTLILRTLSPRLIMSQRSVHVEAQALQP